MVVPVSEGRERWPQAVLAGVVALAPFNIRTSGVGWPELRLRLLAIIAIVALLGLALRSLAVPRWHRPDLIDTIAYGWIAAVWLSALLSQDVMLGAGGAIRVSVAALMIPVTRDLVRTKADAVKVLRALAAGAVVAAVIGLGTWLVGEELAMTEVFVGRVTKLGSFNRLTRPWSHANVAAMAIGASLGAATVIRDVRLRFVALVVLVIALVLTISRGGLLAAGVAAVVFVVLRRRRGETAMVGGLIVVAGVVFLTSVAWTTRVDQLGDQAFYASSLEVPASFSLDGSSTLIEVVVTNDSSRPWPQLGDDQVLVSARWLGPDGLIWTEDRWRLPHDLAPGESVKAPLAVDTRLPVGQYHVRWDLLILDTAYFGQFLGDDPVITTAQITASDVVLADVYRYGLVERSTGIGRIDGWKLAWQDFVSSPLVGVGPNQFADQAAGDLANVQQIAGSHAHNLVLEPLAAWGLLGTVAFLVLGAWAVGRSLRAAWVTRGLVPSVVAVGLVAVVVHGTVDWPLVTITTSIPIGLLVGLALSRAVVASTDPEVRHAT